MEIHFKDFEGNDLIITTNSSGYIVFSGYGKETDSGTRSKVKPTHHGTLEQAIRELFHRKVHSSQATTLKQLQRDIQETREEIATVYNL